MKSNCEECVIDDAMELPPPARSITNFTFAGKLAIETAFNEDVHEFVSNLTPVPEVPEAVHGEWRGNDRYCVPCDIWRDGFNNPLECKCGSPWDMPASAATGNPND